MKYVYASKGGHVASIINRLHINSPMLIDTGNESIHDDYILFTYTDGIGNIPYEVENFLSNNMSHIKGVIVSGDQSYKEAFCFSGDKIAEMCGVECYYKVENEGSDSDIQKMKEILENIEKKAQS